MARTTKTITVSLPPKLYDKVQKIADREDKTKSELFRDMIRVYEEYLDEKRWRKIRAKGAQAAVQKKIKTDADIEKIIHEYRDESVS